MRKLSTFTHFLFISSLSINFLYQNFCHKMLNTALLSRMSQKTEHMRYEKIILDQIRCEEALQVVPAWICISLSPYWKGEGGQGHQQSISSLHDQANGTLTLTFTLIQSFSSCKGLSIKSSLCHKLPLTLEMKFEQTQSFAKKNQIFPKI